MGRVKWTSIEACLYLEMWDAVDVPDAVAITYTALAAGVYPALKSAWEPGFMTQAARDGLQRVAAWSLGALERYGVKDLEYWQAQALTQLCWRIMEMDDLEASFS